MARIDSRPRPRCDVKNNERGRGQERGCNLAFPFRASLLSLLSLSPNPDLLELFPRRMVERFFKKARDFCKFFPFFLPFLRGGYSSYFGIFLFFISRHFLAEIAVYRIPAPRGQTVSCYFDYKVSVVLKKFSWKGFFMIRLLIVVVVIVVCCFKGIILFLWVNWEKDWKSRILF